MYRPPLAIGLMATLVNRGYQDQITACRQTWIPDGLSVGVKTFSFVGETKAPALEEGQTDIIRLDGVGDDFPSSTYKQWYGLRWLLAHQPADFYLLAGTDNYINVAAVVQMLKAYKSETPLLIGGYTESRQVAGVRTLFPLGGGGFILSHAALILIEPHIESIIAEWLMMAKAGQCEVAACDVCIAYQARKMDIPFVMINGMYPSSWVQYFKGLMYPFFIPNFSFEKILVCHYMEPADQHLYHRYKNRQAYQAYSELTQVNIGMPAVVKSRVMIPEDATKVIIFGSISESWAVTKMLIDRYQVSNKTLTIARGEKPLTRHSDKLGLTINDTPGIDPQYLLIGHDIEDTDPELIALKANFPSIPCVKF